MRWVRLLGCAGGLVGAVCLAAAGAAHPEKRVVRKPVLAGTWYAASSAALARQVDGLLSKAGKEPLPPGRPAYLILPHAGYLYSGRAAAVGLKSLRGFSYDRVIILAPAHRWRLEGASVPTETHYATPLGEVAVDRAVCRALLASDAIDTVPEAHESEHTVEIQLPLLQWAFGEHPPVDAFGKEDCVASRFSIVPVVLGACTDQQVNAIVQALEPHVGPRTLVLVSSDFTHYGAGYGYLPFRTDVKANLAKLDGGAVRQVLAKSVSGFDRYIRKTGATICGRAAIRVLLRLLPKAAAGKQLIYYTSGDVTGVWSDTVSYVSLVFCRPGKGVGPLFLSSGEARAAARSKGRLQAEALRCNGHPLGVAKRTASHDAVPDVR